MDAFINATLSSLGEDQNQTSSGYIFPTILPPNTTALCKDVHLVPNEFKCNFITQTKDCDAESFIDYASFIYCGFSPADEPIAIGVSILWTLILFIALGVAATDFLCPALFVISKTLNMSQNVAGVTLIAFGNGSPDIFAAMAGMRQGRPELVIGGLFGGGTFVTMVVVGSIFACKEFKLLPKPFIRDIIFYLIAISWAFYLFVGPQEIHVYDAVGFLLFYLLYVAIVISSRFFDKSQRVPQKPASDGEEGIIFEGIQPDDDPESGMVVMKGFMFLGDNLMSDKPPPALVPIIKITPTDKETEASRCTNNLNKSSLSTISGTLAVRSQSRVSIFEDNSVYSTISSTTDLTGRRGSKRSRASSIFSMSQHQILQIRRASKEFLEKISPIDFNGWKQQNWGGRGFEMVKAPIRLFLLLTTPMADVEGKNQWNKPLSVLHCVAGPVFVVFATGYGTTWIYGVVPVAALITIVAAIISVVIVVTSKYETPPSYYKAYSSYLGFIVAVTWVYFICNEVVSVIRSIGVTFNLSDPTIGLTILAWGNSLLDFVSNVSIARKGFPRMAIAACLGAPLVSILIGVGVPASFTLLANPSSVIKLHPDNLIAVIYFALAGSLVLTLVVLSAFRFQIKRPYGGILIVLYLCLMAVAGSIEFELFPVHLF